MSCTFMHNASSSSSSPLLEEEEEEEVVVVAVVVIVVVGVAQLTTKNSPKFKHQVWNHGLYPASRLHWCISIYWLHRCNGYA